jgi:hypothetical protein
MRIKRYYGDNGELIRYEITKEMNSRAKRYYKSSRKAERINDIMSLVVIIVGIGLMVAWYLINN